MKHKFLQPNKIITLRDYPVYNEHVLKIYFRIFSQNCRKAIPPCPVIHKSLGVPYSKRKDKKANKYNEFLENFLKNNPTAEYFLIDGSHRTTAATLANKKIPVMLLENKKDFEEAKKLTKKGDMFGWHLIENSVEKALTELSKHHIGTKAFLTVEDKTKLMVKEKIIPEYMIRYYKKNKS